MDSGYVFNADPALMWPLMGRKVQGKERSQGWLEGIWPGQLERQASPVSEGGFGIGDKNLECDVDITS